MTPTEEFIEIQRALREHAERQTVLLESIKSYAVGLSWGVFTIIMVVCFELR